MGIPRPAHFTRLPHLKPGTFCRGFAGQSRLIVCPTGLLSVPRHGQAGTESVPARRRCCGTAWRRSCGATCSSPTLRQYLVTTCQARSTLMPSPHAAPFLRIGIDLRGHAPAHGRTGDRTRCSTRLPLPPQVQTQPTGCQQACLPSRLMISVVVGIRYGTWGWGHRLRSRRQRKLRRGPESWWIR